MSQKKAVKLISSQREKAKVNTLDARITGLNRVQKEHIHQQKVKAKITKAKAAKPVDRALRRNALYKALNNERVQVKKAAPQNSNSNNNNNDNNKKVDRAMKQNPLFRAINNLSRTPKKIDNQQNSQRKDIQKENQARNQADNKKINPKSELTTLLVDNNKQILRISNLNLSTTRRDLQDMLNRIGQADDLRLEESEKSLTAEVKYRELDHALQAIKLLHDQPVDGNFLQLRLVNTYNIASKKSKDRRRQ